MATALHINGAPVTYEAEAAAGIYVASGERWWGTLVKWRKGTVGRWNRFTIVDTHPFDYGAVEAAVRAYVAEWK